MFLMDLRDRTTRRVIIRSLALYLAGNALFFLGVIGFSTGLGGYRVIGPAALAGFWAWWVPFLAGHYTLLSIKTPRRRKRLFWSVILFFPGTVLAILPVYIVILITAHVVHYVF